MSGATDAAGKPSSDDHDKSNNESNDDKVFAEDCRRMLSYSNLAPFEYLCKHLGDEPRRHTPFRALLYSQRTIDVITLCQAYLEVPVESQDPGIRACMETLQVRKQVQMTERFEKELLPKFRNFLIVWDRVAEETINDDATKGSTDEQQRNNSDGLEMRLSKNGGASKMEFACFLSLSVVDDNPWVGPVAAILSCLGSPKRSELLEQVEGLSEAPCTLHAIGALLKEHVQKYLQGKSDTSEPTKASHDEDDKESRMKAYVMEQEYKYLQSYDVSFKGLLSLHRGTGKKIVQHLIKAKRDDDNKVKEKVKATEVDKPVHWSKPFADHCRSLLPSDDRSTFDVLLPLLTPRDEATPFRLLLWFQQEFQIESALNGYFQHCSVTSKSWNIWRTISSMKKEGKLQVLPSLSEETLDKVGTFVYNWQQVSSTLVNKTDTEGLQLAFWLAFDRFPEEVPSVAAAAALVLLSSIQEKTKWTSELVRKISLSLQPMPSLDKEALEFRVAPIMRALNLFDKYVPLSNHTKKKSELEAKVAMMIAVKYKRLYIELGSAIQLYAETTTGRKQNHDSSRDSSTNAKRSDTLPVVPQDGKFDVVCGENVDEASHRGNQIFVSMVARFVHAYAVATTVEEKMAIVQKLKARIYAYEGKFVTEASEPVDQKESDKMVRVALDTEAQKILIAQTKSKPSPQATPDTQSHPEKDGSSPKAASFQPSEIKQAVSVSSQAKNRESRLFKVPTSPIKTSQYVCGDKRPISASSGINNMDAQSFKVPASISRMRYKRPDPPSQVMDEQSEVTAWTTSLHTLSTGSPRPPSQLVLKFWNRRIIPLLNEMLRDVSATLQPKQLRNTAAVKAATLVYVVRQPAGAVKTNGEPTAYTKTCVSMAVFFYHALESVFLFEAHPMATHLATFDELHRSVLACCILCVLKAVKRTKTIPLRNNADKIATVLRIAKVSPFVFFKFADIFVHATTSHKVLQQTASSLVLPQVLVQEIEKAKTGLLDHLLWVESESPAQNGKTLPVILSSFLQTKSLWPPDQLTDKDNSSVESEPPEEMTSEDVSSEYRFVVYILRKVLHCCQLRFQPLCRRLNVPLVDAASMTMRFLICNHVELLFNHRLDQVILCCLFGTAKSRRFSFTFRTMIEEFFNERGAQIGEEECERVIQPIRVSDELQTGTVIDFYNEVFLPKMGDFFLKSSTEQRLSSSRVVSN